MAQPLLFCEKKLDLIFKLDTRLEKMGVNFIYGESDGDLSYYFNDYILIILYNNVSDAFTKFGEFFGWDSFWGFHLK